MPPADEAAKSLTDSHLRTRDEQKLRRLERLAQATREIMSDLDALSLRQRLSLIARSVVEILQAETSGVFLVHGSELVLEASHGQMDEFVPGRLRLPIHDEPGGGLTGHIAFQGKLFNAHGDALTSHPAVAGRSQPPMVSGVCYSLLAMPLLKRTGEGEKLIGLLRADNKKGDDGWALANLGFTPEDESILTIFAEAAVVALENAELVERLKEEKDFTNRLISSSPDGIVAVDRQGRITEVNRRAEELLGYSKDEILGKPVDPLYFDPAEPRRIGRLLHQSPDQHIHQYETSVRSKAGERIPILEASTWLLGAGGERVGSVAYFEDLRERKALEHREKLLLRASNVLTGAELLDDGLQRLAEMMVALLGRSFCTILVNEEDSDVLVSRAASRNGEPRWNPGRRRIPLSEWPGLSEILQMGRPRIVRWSDPSARPILERLSRWLGFDEEIEEVLIVPLKVENRIVGQLDLGKLRGEGRSLDDQEIDLIAAIAAQITVLIDRFQLLEVKARREKLLEALFQQVQRAQNAAEVLARLTLLEDQKNVLMSIVREIREALACGAVVLFSYDQGTGELILPPSMAGVHRPVDPQVDSALVLAMAEHDRPYVISDVTRDEKFKDSAFLREQGVQSSVAIPLKAAGRTVGVLFIHYRNPRRFTADDMTTMELFANQAAVAIRNVQLFESLTTKLSQQEALADLSRELLAANSVQNAMDRAVESAARTLDTEFAGIVLPDPEGRLILSAAVGWERERVGRFVLQPGPGSQTGFTIQQRAPVAVLDYREEKRFKAPEVLPERGIQSGLSVPMFRQGNAVVGAMLIHTRRSRRFTADDEIFLSLIANQTAIALGRAQQYEASQRKSAYLAALYEASTALTAQFNLERRQILEQIIQPAIEGIIGLQGPKPTLGTIEIYDEDRDELIIESIYPPELSGEVVQRVGERRGLRRSLLNGQRTGIVGRTVITGQPQLVRDVLADPDYVVYRSSTRSELAVPLIDRDLGRVIGVLNVESNQSDAFHTEDREALQALAELAVIAIQNVRRIEALRTQTTLAWLGLGTAVGRHELASSVGKLLSQVFLLEKALEKPGTTKEQMAEQLTRIEGTIRAIGIDRPTESVDEGRRSILVNDDLIDAFEQRFLESRPSRRQRFAVLRELAPSARIHVNPQWLFRVLDILVNNAAQAGARSIILGSRPGSGRDGWAEIYVADDGSGIADSVRDRLLREPIREGSKGLGTGLLIAQEVIRIYGGTLHWEDRKPRGTTMVISLPLDEDPVDASAADEG